MIDMKNIFGRKFLDANYAKTLEKIKELIKQQDLLKTISQYQVDMMAIFPTYFTKAVYKAITGKELVNTGLAEAVGISALMSAPLDDVIDEEMSREERGSKVHAGIILSLVGTVYLQEKLAAEMSEGKVNEAMRFYLKSAIKATEGNENELHEERFNFDEYVEQYKISLTVPFTMGIKVACLLTDTTEEIENKLLEVGEKLGLVLRIANDINHFEKHVSKGFVSLPVKYIKENKLDINSSKDRETAIKHILDLGLENLGDCKELLNSADLPNGLEIHEIISNFEDSFNREKIVVTKNRD